MHDLAVLSHEDHETYKKFLKLGILEPVERGFRKKPKYLMPVMCCDGSHFADKVAAFLDQAEISRDCKDGLFHPTLLNGGVLNLGVIFPSWRTLPLWLNGLTIMGNIEDALKLKGKTVHQVPLIGHHPCGVAQQLGLSLVDNIEWILRAHVRVEKKFPREAHVDSVKCYMHICYADEHGHAQRIVHLLNRYEWDRWLRSPENEDRLLRFIRYRYLTILFYRWKRKLKCWCSNRT